MFVNATLDEVAATADRCGLTMLQLHGDEGPAFCREAARRTGCKIIKAARVRDAAQVQALRPFRTDYHLLDAHSSVAPGGTGQSFDWTLVRHHGATPPIVLSGGLTPDTVAEAIAATRPFAVDTASGTEAEPGRKDPAKLAAFVERGGRRGRPSRRPGMSSPPLERRFGPYGGRYVPETLIPALDELEREWLAARADPAFQDELGTPAARLRRPADPAVPRSGPVGRHRRRGVPEARGPACTPARTS